MDRLRFALFGTGYWSTFQLAGWLETGGAECVAVFDRKRERAEALAQRFCIPQVYTSAEALLDQEALDFVDVCTSVESHASFVRLAAARGVPAVCQKPMATTLEEAEAMVETCRRARVPFFVNENWRWQHPIRELKRALEQGGIGRPFRARIQFANSFPVFDNQPFLKELDRFILTDIGSHILDTARFLFGEARSLYCLTQRINPDIMGEDVATVMMQMGQRTTVTCEMSYASRTETERFPETYVFIEGEKGFLELGPDYWIRETTSGGTLSRRMPPPRYPWADPAYDLVHSSIVPCQANLLQALRGEGEAETTGEDNLRTVGLVFGAYRSAATGEPLGREELMLRG